MRKLRSLLLLVGALSFFASAPAAEIRKAIVFAGTNQVRVELDLASIVDRAVKVNGEITEVPDGAVLWKGALGQATLHASKPFHLSQIITNLQPQLWSPSSPKLYKLKISAQQSGQLISRKTVRFGFRSFEIRDGQFLLNGHPTFLRGVAINPPDRGIPAKVAESRKFAEDYVRFMKSQNFNIFRLSVDESAVWFDVCDELGMMLYAGHYGSPFAADTGKRGPPQNFQKSIEAYKDLFEGFAPHPSIVEYYLSNELPTSGERGAAFSEFLTRACAELKKWDNSRPYIGNAGYGEGREGDVCDVHRYWGWYYNSFLTYYNLRDKLYPQPLFGDPQKNQPLTFTECVGSFTGSSGEFNIVRSKQLAPSLGWIGHTETPREDALAYQAFMAKQACESFRRMRPLNPRLAGLMPFTILFHNWSGISSFAEMKPKPVVEAMRLAYQPVLLSWELWTPQVYAGSELHPIAHVINDHEQTRALQDARLEFHLRGKDGKDYVSGEVPLPSIPYFGTSRQTLSLKLPSDMPTGDYILSGVVIENGQCISTNVTSLFVAARQDLSASAKNKSTVYLYDPSGETAAAFQKLNIAAESLSDLSYWPSNMTALILGERCWDKPLSEQRERLQHFVKNGGRVLCLQPNPVSFEKDWLPQKISFFESSPNDSDYPPRSRPFREQMNINPERPEHPVFRGLNRRQLSLWSDYSGWDQTKPGFPQVYPVTTGFKLDEPSALARSAILADYDRGLEGVALCEMFDGTGSVLLSGFDLVHRIGLDPAADRLLANLVSYTAANEGHEVHPLIEQPIRWGNYPSERGVVCGSLNGLLVNAEWIPAPHGPKSKGLPSNTGSWNMLPGEQFVPHGRNPFGAFGYSTGSSLKDGNPDAKTGEGFFWVRIPEGKKFVVTSAINPEKKPGVLKVFLNDEHTPSSSREISSRKTVQLRTPIPPGSRELCIHYAGDKTLVLLQTAFE